MKPPLKPYVPAEKSLAEFTVQAVVLGLVLSVIMCAANIYVGLKAGMTVSAAIPASVISMGILRGLMKRGTILENNVVHTIASSGESLAAGIIFTVPALVLLGIWTEFNYWETTLIAMAGGVMGVVMMIPLRRAMIVEQEELTYPEGVACAEVLKAGDRGGSEMMGIFSALGLGALFKFLGDSVGLFAGTFERAFRAGKTAFYAGTDVSPMLMAVGFIVGWEISLLIFMGGALSFMVAIPVLGWDYAFGSDVAESVGKIWDTQIRYFGIGAMVVAGVYSIIKVGASLGAGVRTAWRGIRGHEDTASLPRTEQGISGRFLFTLMFGCLLLSTYVYWMMTQDLATTAITAVLMFVLGFFFVAVASYIVGLVGSSNSPVSGMTICTVLVTAGLLILLGHTGQAGMLATLGVAGVVCCAACTSGDICQDLKIGHIVGATPRNLQKGEVLGTLIPALIIAPTLTLLHKAYGIGPDAGSAVHPDPLPAPQAAMFEKLVGGLFGGSVIPWHLVGFGAGVGVLAILIDRSFLAPKNTKFRLHAMPLAVGMYLPWTVTFPMLFGGLAFLFVNRSFDRRGVPEEKRKAGIHRGLLFASGLVAGEAIMGILIALLLVMGVSRDWLGWSGGLKDAVSLVAFGLMILLLVKKAIGSRKSPAEAS